MARKAHKIVEAFCVKAEKEAIKFITTHKEMTTEAEIINALIFKGLRDFKDSDLMLYREALERGEF